MTRWWITLICSPLLFAMTTFRSSIQDGTKFCCRCQKIPSDDISLYKLKVRESDQLKNRISIVQHGDSSENIDAQLSKIEDNGEVEYRS